VEDPARPEWTCASCGQSRPLALPDRAPGKPLQQCVACGNIQFYRQKNFPQWLGVSLLAVACTSFFVLQVLYLPELAWIVLLGSAGVDALVYLLVGDVLICYRCFARHYGWPRNRAYDPFELAIAEKYRQERLRRELAAKQQ
jgi:hypothetical protein